MVACRRREAGFTYVGLIVLVTIIGLVGAATLKADALLRRAAAEQELLEIGAAFSAALTSYAEATPRGQPPQPPSLQELLKDPRFPGTRRHLRKIFVDPITGKAEWGIVWLNKGNAIGGGNGGTGIVAVYSLSEAKPLKQANFDARFQNLENREHLSAWKFAATGQGVAQGQAGQPGQAQIPPRQPPQNPAAPLPSLFPEKSNPANPGNQPPAEPPSRPEPAPESAPPQNLAVPEPQEPPPAEESGEGEASRR
ncbi:type II secretion system pseudopilin PulG [Massilia sp. WF1]|uniref:type II secretion system protein n=1 Tax=unclassified Massilia TaxID=2609279 RepID=UPI00064A1713|nr:MULTISPECIES: type II secretion system protein [unclassified Massilia]ALK96370.1 type II secretion system pseudopilin PulG [Massilia sp. WG5]KLU37875.1 type II secretion system pseudopilin PulG [Massilia sp. WF1]